MSKEKMEQVIKETYTPDRYCKLFLYWWAMVGEGFVAAQTLFDRFDLPDDFFDYEIDSLANDFLNELES